MFDPTSDSPSVEDIHGDAHARTSSLPADELLFEPDDFPAEPPPSDDEFERMAAEAADRRGYRARVIERGSVGVMAFLTVEAEADGRCFNISDLASVYADSPVGTRGTAWLDCTGQWAFTPNPEPVQPEIPAPQPILTRPVTLDPVAWRFPPNKPAA